MSSPHRRPRRERNWLGLLLSAALAVWLFVSVLFASRLSALKQGWQGNSSSEGAAPGGQSRRQLGAGDSGDALGPAPRPAAPPLNLSALSAAAGLLDPKISGLDLPLSPWERQGGWQYNAAAFDRALTWPAATVLSPHSPRLLLISDFLSPEEVAHLVALAEAGFERSEVVSDGVTVTKARTSYGAWLNGPRRTPTVLGVQHRIASLTGIPEEFGESLYVLRYEPGQKYKVHTDHCNHDPGEALSESCRAFLGRAGGPGCGAGAGGATCGDRLATLVIYLQTPEEGGATVFPSAPRPRPGGDAGGDGSSSDALPPLLQVSEGGEVPWYCRDDAQVLKASPHPGDALLFYDYVPAEGAGGNGTAAADPSSAHAGCPPLRGTKLVATRWMRAAEFA